MLICREENSQVLGMRNSHFSELGSKYLISITIAHSGLIIFDVYMLIGWGEATYTDIS
jgi:hypothetical protein